MLFETQKHLFFVYLLARYIWNVVGVSLNLKNTYVSSMSLYHECFATFTDLDRKLVMIGVVAI
jgi:hypothetical protein